MTARAPVEFFPELTAINICRHAFIQRIPGIDVSHDKAQALKKLDAVHREARYKIGMADWPLLTAQQIHDSGVCTACDINRYYSYRAEKGKTGRMLALLGLV